MISNQHYAELSDDVEVTRQYHYRPIACKLADFGESRSHLIQTQTFIATKTTNVDRGIVVFMAPEILLNEFLISGASIPDLLLADIWALGMIFFCMINPSLKFPYRSEIRSAGCVSSQEELKKFICSLFRQKKHPLPDTNYEVQRATVWCGLEEVYRRCVNFDRHHRMPLEEAAKILKRSSDGLSENVDVVHLKVSQGTATERFDQRMAARLLKETAEHDNLDGPVQLESAPANDATNACAFISVKIADRLLDECREGGDFFGDLAEVVEDTIWKFTGANKCAQRSQQHVRHSRSLLNSQ